MISIDCRNGKPIYEQIADEFENLISQGVLEADSQLPSVRQLAVELSINPNTIQKAYGELEGRGLTYSIRGKGSFVSPESENLRLKKLYNFYRQLDSLIQNALRSGITEQEILDAVNQCLEKRKGGNT